MRPRVLPDAPEKSHRGRKATRQGDAAEDHRIRNRRYYFAAKNRNRSAEVSDEELDRRALEKLRQEGLR